MVLAIPEVMSGLIYLHSVMIFHDTCERVLHLVKGLILISMHLGVAVITEVGIVIIAKPGGCLILTEIT
jgi:hypothetical protein